MKNFSFLSENFQFLEMRLSIYLNRRVFVMQCIFFIVESGTQSNDPMELAELIEQNILTISFMT